MMGRSAWTGAGMLLAIGCSDGHLDAFSSQSGFSGAAATSGLGGRPSAGASGAPSSGSSGTTPGAGGGAGGATAAGGSGGASGSGGTVAGTTVLLDDFEDGDNVPLVGDWWYTTFADYDIGPAPDREGMALRAFSGGDRPWAIVGLDLEHGYDATRFTELRFMARAAEGSTRELGVNFLDTTESHFEVVIQLSTQWQEFVVPIADAVRIDGSALVLNQASLSHLQMWVRAPVAFDIWFDDFRLVP